VQGGGNALRQCPKAVPLLREEEIMYCNALRNQGGSPSTGSRESFMCHISRHAHASDASTRTTLEGLTRVSEAQPRLLIT
jgi:hypothetical protein